MDEIDTDDIGIEAQLEALRLCTLHILTTFASIRPDPEKETGRLFELLRQHVANTDSNLPDEAQRTSPQRQAAERLAQVHRALAAMERETLRAHARRRG